MMKMAKVDYELSQEQKLFISKAKEGDNILVDACIGSGKTTAIQRLCLELPRKLNILYLTYNKLLKIDAKKRIKIKNVTVTNYHGFAYGVLKRNGISAGVSDLIQKFLQEKPKLKHFDILIMDEYQDIDLEISHLLEYIKETNPNIQIIAVGDMEQKIYDNTTLNINEFINNFLGEHLKLEFTKCFRLSNDLASMLGRVWKKNIIGVNENCEVVKKMSIHETVIFLSNQDPSDILCLGSRDHDLAEVLNVLEEKYPEKFNKKSVYASIRDSDESISPNDDSAIFTTFDSSKGMERKICVVFDFTEEYWDLRLNKSQQSYTILRNIFCVAASRGKEKIIFVDSNKEMLSEKTLSIEVQSNVDFKNINISEMFEFKYKEDIEKCYNLLEITRLNGEKISSVIDINNKDGLIDLSPCIGIYQEAVFFSKYDIHKDIELCIKLNKNKIYFVDEDYRSFSLDNKILLLTALETSQNRYYHQVKTPFVSENERQMIVERLGLIFSQDENVQQSCSIEFFENEHFLFSAVGYADVVKNDTVYELKFVSELMHEHFLQCASYLIALNLKKGVLWNTRNNERYEIKVPDKKAFLDAVARTVTKSYLDKYY